MGLLLASWGIRMQDNFLTYSSSHQPASLWLHFFGSSFLQQGMLTRFVLSFCGLCNRHTAGSYCYFIIYGISLLLVHNFNRVMNHLLGRSHVIQDIRIVNLHPAMESVMESGKDRSFEPTVTTSSHLIISWNHKSFVTLTLR